MDGQAREETREQRRRSRKTWNMWLIVASLISGHLAIFTPHIEGKNLEPFWDVTKAI